MLFETDKSGISSDNENFICSGRPEAIQITPRLTINSTGKNVPIIPPIVLMNAVSSAPFNVKKVPIHIMDKITQIVNALLSTSSGNMPYASVLAINDNDAGKQRKLFEFCSHAAKKPTRLPNAVETQ